MLMACLSRRISITELDAVVDDLKEVLQGLRIFLPLEGVFDFRYPVACYRVLHKGYYSFLEKGELNVV